MTRDGQLPRGAGDGAAHLPEVLAGVQAGRALYRRAAMQNARTGREDAMVRRFRLDTWDRTQTLLLEELDGVPDQALGSLEAAPSTVIAAHRQSWMTEALTVTLSSRRGERAVIVDDGAAVAATVVAAQPSLLIIEAQLPGWGAHELLPIVAATSPRTVTAVVGVAPAAVAGMLAAGAVATFARQIPVDLITSELLRLARTNHASPIPA